MLVWTLYPKRRIDPNPKKYLVKALTKDPTVPIRRYQMSQNEKYALFLIKLFLSTKNGK